MFVGNVNIKELKPLTRKTAVLNLEVVIIKGKYRCYQDTIVELCRKWVKVSFYDPNQCALMNGFFPTSRLCDYKHYKELDNEIVKENRKKFWGSMTSRRKQISVNWIQSQQSN